MAAGDNGDGLMVIDWLNLTTVDDVDNAQMNDKIDVHEHIASEARQKTEDGKRRNLDFYCIILHIWFHSN